MITVGADVVRAVQLPVGTPLTRFVKQAKQLDTEPY